MALFLRIGKEQIQANVEIPVDVLACLPELMQPLLELLFAEFARQRAVLSGLELAGVHHDHFRTSAFSLALQLADEFPRSIKPLRFAVSSLLEGAGLVLFNSKGPRVREQKIDSLTVFVEARRRRAAMEVLERNWMKAFARDKAPQEASASSEGPASGENAAKNSE